MARSVEYLEELVRIPSKAEKLLLDIERVSPGSQSFISGTRTSLSGAGYNYPIALEGALKLKEISYIHARAIQPEMKHGPIADRRKNGRRILAPGMRSRKGFNQYREVRSRGGKVIAFVTDGDSKLEKKTDHLFRVPRPFPACRPY
jgi:glucosamine--fructose-6-phosphate aminotransferase (isomerizing)